MKKNKLANVIMITVILVIAAAGILWVGSIQGWFDQDDSSGAALSTVRGIVTMERDGVAFSAEADTVLRTGDKLTCDPKATAKITVGESTLTLADEAVIEVTDAAAFSVAAGTLFVDATDTVTLNFDGKDVEFTDTAASLSVRPGAQSISVFSGTAADTQARQILEWVGDEQSVSELSIQSLNETAILWLRSVNADKVLCFTNEDLDALEAERLAEQQALLSASTETEPVTEEPEETTEEPEQQEPEETPEETPEEPSEEAEEPEVPIEEEEPVEVEPEESAVSNPTCTVTIRCDTILDNWDRFDQSKAGYVPANGIILSTSTIEFTEGETVFDVLCRVCDLTGLQLEYSWTPMYDSYYVEGINYLYEFDCGSESGWMYKVNGWFPNYGCSSYNVEDGDSIVWCYTCVGLGADVGGSNR